MQLSFSSLLQSTLLLSVPLAEGRCTGARPASSGNTAANDNAGYHAEGQYPAVEDPASDYASQASQASPADVHPAYPAFSEGMDPVLSPTKSGHAVYPHETETLSPELESSAYMQPGFVYPTNGNGVGPVLASTTSSASSMSGSVSEAATFTVTVSSVSSSSSSSFGNGVGPVLASTTSSSSASSTTSSQGSTSSSSSSSFGNGIDATLTATSFSVSVTVSVSTGTDGSVSTFSSSTSSPVLEISTVSSSSASTTAPFASTSGATIINDPSVIASSTDNPTSASTSASVTTSSGVVSPVVTNQAYIDTIIRHHNIHRTNHSAPDMTWDTSLADTARTISESCNYQHDTTTNGGGYGQNIGAGFLSTSMGAFVTNGLYNSEVNAYTYYGSEPDLNTLDAWGHFSQIVWVGSTTVGCYTNDCTATGLANAPGIPPYFTVCNYRPAGNVVGEFSTNVLASIGLPTVDASFGCAGPENCAN